jgi:serine/threonine-protein kinase
MSDSSIKGRAPPGSTPRSPVTQTRRLGALRHEALMLAMQGRHAEAGRLLLDEIGVSPDTADALLPEERRLVGVAATYLQKAGEADQAARLFLALGEVDRAVQVRAADDALPPSRVAEAPASTDTLPISSSLATETDALRCQGDALASAGRHYEAAASFVKAGDAVRALAELTQVPAAALQYRAAARAALRLLIRLERCSAPQVQYVAPLVAEGPRQAAEVLTFVRWSDLLLAQGFTEAATITLRAVQGRFPDHAELASRIDRLTQSAPASRQSASLAESTTQRSISPGGAPTSDHPGPTTVRISATPPPLGADPVAFGPGLVIADRFRIESEIGRGGMATVFAATDLELDEEVALKVVSGQMVTRELMADAVARFREELKLLRKLRHPNVVQVYDIGIHAGHRYYTMELLHGRSLASMVGKPLDVRWCIDCLVQVAAGLHAAHQLGVVHRDVKPENLFVTDRSQIKIMDFGIAKSTQRRGQTVQGTLAGTPEYIAPEQITGFSTVGPAADQYALGVVAYQMFTGRLPFDHPEMMPLLMLHLNQAPTAPREIVSTLPRSIDRILLRMLAKDPAERFASCEEVGAHFGAAEW